MSDKKEKIVILGYGWVGQANALALVRMGYEVFYYDVVTPKKNYPEYEAIYEKVKSLSKSLEKEGPDTWYFVCVGDRVSTDGIQDISLIVTALDSIREAKGRIILRSTVLPQYLNKLNFDYYLPEFLHELKAVEECLQPPHLIIGKRNPGLPDPGFLTVWRARSRKVFDGTPHQASYIKYLSNVWNALRIAFVNEWGDAMIHQGGLSSSETQEAINFLFEKKSYLRYGKSFGGHCLPKDSLAFAAMHKDSPLLKAIPASNSAHQEIEKVNVDLPTWFSFWEQNNNPERNMSFRSYFWHKLNAFQSIKFARKKIKPLVHFFINRIINEKGALSRAKKNWNKLGVENARYYMNVGTKSNELVDEFELKETGQADYKRYILDDELITKKLGNLKEKSVLEIGGGIGRMTEFLAINFREVYGVDISEVMTEQAVKRLAKFSNIKLTVNDGQSIPFADGHFDLVYSQQVFKHIPTYSAVNNYFKEISRSLKSGGLAKIQLRTGPGVQKWKPTYGVSFDQDRARQMAEKSGLRFIKHQFDGDRNFWIWLEK